MVKRGHGRPLGEGTEAPQPVESISSSNFSLPLLVKIVPFLSTLGIQVRRGTVSSEAFLPGVRIENGGIVVDEATLRHPSDVLHEAGHLAVMPAEQRAIAQQTVESDPAMEMATLAWSYAAARFLGIDSRSLFLDDYKAGGAAMAEAFDGGGGPGIPMLAWWGMTIDPRVAQEQGVPGFPVMSRWLR